MGKERGVTSEAVPMATYRWLTSRWCSCRDNLRCVVIAMGAEWKGRAHCGCLLSWVFECIAADRTSDETQKTASAERSEDAGLTHTGVKTVWTPVETWTQVTSAVKPCLVRLSYARKWWEGKIPELLILNAFQPESKYGRCSVAALINIFISKKMKCLCKYLKGHSDYQLPTALQSFSIFQLIALIWLLRFSIKLVLVKAPTNRPAKHQTTDSQTSHSSRWLAGEHIEIWSSFSI